MQTIHLGAGATLIRESPAERESRIDAALREAAVDGPLVSPAQARHLRERRRRMVWRVFFGLR